MKHLFASFLLLFCLITSIHTIAQDTTVVQTFTFDNSARSGTFEFPDDPEKSYRQILMEYSLRCYEGGINQGSDAAGVGCREWDYSCTTYLVDSTSTDSTQASHPTHTISNFGGSTYDYTDQPTYTYYQTVQTEAVYEEVLDETTTTIGEGTESVEHFDTGSDIGKVQYLYRGEELIEAGLQEGNITGMQLDLSQIGGTLDFLRIKLRRSLDDELDADDLYLTLFTEVYFLNTPIEATGMHQFNFHQPYDWDGDDNILVELSYQNSGDTPEFVLEGHEVDYTCTVYSNQRERYTRFVGNNFIDVPMDAFDQISDEISISFWAYGADILPVNTSIIEGTDADGNRQANIHLPWSNSGIYWDCGNDGGGYDRIDRVANSGEIKGKWNHWTFVKNAPDGWMKISKNGTTWKTGTDKNKTIDLENFRIGRAITGGYGYQGNITQMAIFNTELDTETIQEWMNKEIDETHPEYDNLIAYYPFNETEGNNSQDMSANQLLAEFTGQGLWGEVKASDLFRNFEESNLRPNITFVQGEYVQTINEYTFLDSLLNPPNTINSFAVEGNDLVEIGSNQLWQAGYSYVYDELGETILDSVVNLAAGEIDIGTLNYYNKTVSNYELTSFVTPYGFFLDLGPNGKTWTMDVTDLGPLLKGNKRIYVGGGGQNQTEMDIRFVFIEGTPPRDVLDVQNIWSTVSPTNKSYAAIANDNHYEPRNVFMNAEASQYKIRVAQSGHGQNGEFVPRNHFINIDGGANDFNFEGWKKCGDNPVYPQGGTWIFDRAGWCPSMETDIYHFELEDKVSPGAFSEIDYGITEVADMSSANYRVSVQLVSYGPTNFENDATIFEVIKPSNRVEHARLNPSCNSPIVVLQNTGSNELTSATFTYYVDGGEAESYTWEGSLGFLEKEEITLPISDISFWFTETENARFHVELNEDDYNENNHYVSEFSIPEEQVRKFIINLKTNNNAVENSYTVTDLEGNVILERSGMSNQTEYNDELELTANGCYTLEVLDSPNGFYGEDGLEFWYWSAVGENVGSGYFRLKDSLESITHTFEPDFGSFTRYDFSFFDPALVDTMAMDTTIVDTMAMDTTIVDTMTAIQDLGYRLFSTYPNPTKDLLNVELHGFSNRNLQLQLFNNLGQLVYDERIYTRSATFVHQINTMELATGVYFLKMEDENGQMWNKQIFKE